VCNNSTAESTSPENGWRRGRAIEAPKAPRGWHVGGGVLLPTGGEAWGGVVLLPTGGEAWGGAVPLPRKFLDFCYQNGELLCILGGIIYRLPACFSRKKMVPLVFQN